MKTQIKRFSKSALAVVLTLCMLVSCMTVGIIATDAAQSAEERVGASDNSEALGYTSIAGRLYFDNSKTNWPNVYLYVGHSTYAKSYTMTNTGYHNIWYVSISDSFTDRTKLYFANHNDSPYGQKYGIDKQYGWNTNNKTRTALTTANNNDANSLFTPSSNSAGTLTRSYPRVVAGTLASNGWDDCTDIMTYSSGQWTKTYTNVAPNDYVIAVVGFYNNWSPSYRWSAKGTLTGNNIATWADANDNDHNIKLTTTAKSNVTITLNSNNNVDITVTPVATNYTGITAVAKGTTDGTNYSVHLGSIKSSTTVNSSTGLAVNAGSYTNYTFVKWVASGSGTFDNANNASTTFHPAASSEVATAQYKRSYSVTKNSPSNGTITLSKSSGILAGETFKVTLAPSSGYRVATFTVDNVDKKSSLNSSNEYTHTATGTGNSFEVNATFEAIPATTIYIKKTMPTYNHFYAWNSANTTAVTAAWTGDQFTSWSTTSDGKYYYKSYTWNCAGFKFILNDNSDSNKTTDSAAYDTGKSYYIDSATNNKAAVLTEGVPTAKAITYTSTYSSDPDVNWGGTKPATAYPGEEVSFTVSAKTGYKLTSVTYTPAGGSATTISATSGTYKFTMPAGAVTVTANTVKQYTVTLTAGTGFDSKKYKVGSGTQQTYSSEITVDSGSNVVFDVTYTTGYEYDSDNSTLSGAVASNSNKTFTLSNVSADTIVTLAAKKITWSGLTAVGKYTEDGTNYNGTFATNPVSIASTSATQLDGTTVTAPATVTVSGVKYNFVGFVATNGSVTNAATSGTNKTTTFKPSAASAVCTARYKKVYTITSSVDDTGTGAGTVTTSKTSVEAGGSYTITATAKDGSAIESVTVNTNNKGTNATTEVSGVSADQTVKVKFKSNITIRGNSTIGTNWDSGDAMTSNAAGTEFTKTYSNVAGSSSGTSYEFKLHNGTSYSDDSSATITITGGASTGTCTQQSSVFQNYVLTLKKAANVTVKSNGTKITEIKVVPVNATKYAVTFKKADNTTITGQYEGTNFSTALADATVQVYAGDEISYEVKAADGYYIKSLDGVSGFTANTTYNGKLTVNAATTITPTAAQLLSITAKSNKSDRGTVQVDAVDGKAYPGQIVKVTVTPKNGVLKSLTVKDASGADVTLRDSAQTSSLNYSQLDVATVTALMYDFFNKSGEALGAAVNDEAVGADTVKYFTMPNSSVTVSATFDPYSAESTWYYNGYDTSGNAVSGYHARQMTEAMVGGEKFSYYHVEGRTGTDQLMTVSNGAASSGTRYVYFTASAEGGWSTDENHQYAYFYNDNGDAGNAWPGYKMTEYTTNDYRQKVYRVAIPTTSSPTGVVFNNASNAKHQTTNVTDLSKGGYYLLNTYHWDDTLQKTVHDWQSYDCTYPGAGYSTGTEYFYGSNNDVSTIYSTDNNGKSIFGTTGFYSHGTNNKNYAKPRLTASETGDYYVNVLYPGKTYTINGVTKTIGTDPVVIWTTDPLAGDDEAVKIYAKDGSIRSDSNGATYANIADTKIYAADGTTTVGTKQSGSITNQTYETYKAAKGDTIVIKTTIGATDSSNLSNADALKAKYYVRGFCVNGEVSELLDWNADGEYTLTYKVPEDYEGKNIEITPIYYLKDTSANPIVTYRVTGFTDALKAVGSGKPGWGDTLYTYPFYGKLDGQNNAFGAYPGQPMVYYKGQYQMQIPQKSTAWDPYQESSSTVNNTNVSGVKMSNGYWDSVHKTIMGYGDNSSSADHVQTYDYGDFYKIFNEKKPVDNIVFDFKYRTAKHNLTDIITTSTTASDLNTKYGTGGNGFELLTNFHGRNVDLFGTPLSGDAADPTKTTPVYVVSTGGVIDNQSGVENIAGYYATEWVVYGSTNGTDYNRITDGKTNGKSSIPPEVLVLNDDNDTSFSTTTYPSADANHNVTNWKALYTALEAYRGKPVYISYEAADAQQAQGKYYTGTGGATRNDGRWLYSKNGENITSKIKIQYSNDNGVNYTELDTSAPQVTGLSAYFTNDGVEGQMTYSTTIDPDKTFDFEAKTTNADYKFVGWFMEDGTKITTDNSSYTERSGSYTFVAKFMKVESGQLILSHSVDTNDTYKGAGTAKISAVVKDGDEVVRTYDLSTSDITLDDKIIKSDSDYTIEVTLEATATGQDTLGTTVLANPSGQVSTYFNPASTTTEGKTKTIVLNSFTVKSLFSETTQSVKNIIYHSYFNQVKFHYQVTFQYKDRFGETKNYTRQGYLTTAQVANENYVDTSSSTKKLLPAFIQTIAPHVSNFGETITWNFDTSGYAFAVSGNDYNVTATISATQTSTEKRNITFKLPYEHNDGIAVLNGNVGTAAATTKDFALTGDRAVDYKAVPVLPNSGVNGIYTNDKFKNWIAAPAVINDNGTQKYFQYWSIASTSAEDREIERCYFNAFNYAALDNFVVTPKYGTEKTDISQSGIYTGVTYLETSRNQWNDNQERAKTDRGKAADLLYNDFVINFNYKGAQLNLNGADAADVQELGVVVERIQELDIKQDGTKDTDISKYTGIDKHEDTVKDIINGSTNNRYSKHIIDKKDLDNKNSYMLYDAFYNGAGWNLENQKSAQSYTYKNYVYRVYTYIKYTDENNVDQIVLSEVPGYFTMYDEAVKDYVAPKTSSTNP